MTALTRHRHCRALHPGAWWVWAACLAVAASRTMNPLLLALTVALAGYVVAARRQSSPWSRSFVVFLRIGLVAVAIRVVLFALLVPGPGDHVLVRLPALALPHWMAGMRFGGPVSLDGVLAAAYDGMRLAVILVCVGAANALTSPRRLIKSLPAALYEAGVAMTVALAFVPQAVSAVGRIRAARRLRGRADRGPRALRGIALPVLDGALERSVDLAAAMEARGFGRRGATPPAVRRTTAVLTLAGLTGMLASSYGLLRSSAPVALGLPLLLAGAALAGAGLLVGARRGGRSRYRPDRWRAAEWCTVGCGLAVAAVFLSAHGLATPTSPPALPSLPGIPALALAVALLPAWLTPPLPATATVARRSRPPRRPAEVPA